MGYSNPSIYLCSGDRLFNHCVLSKHHILQTNIEYLKGVGPKRAELLKAELAIHTFEDLLGGFPFRYVDKSIVTPIQEVRDDGQFVQVKGVLTELKKIPLGRQKRLVGQLRDKTGTLELIWFQGLNWLENMPTGIEYTAFGKVTYFKGRYNMAHPELERVIAGQPKALFEPVYSSTEKLNAGGLDSRGRAKLIKALLEKIDQQTVPETLPDYLLDKLKLMGRYAAIKNLHFPEHEEVLERAKFRMKFEELFFHQLNVLHQKQLRAQATKGYVFDKVGDYVHAFYEKKLPFTLTGAQKRVIKEIRKDLGSGFQMNRLLQGDVGSGKTVVALMTMLIALDNGFQSCLLAPTEILANQHYASLTRMVEGLGVRVGFLTGNIKGQARKEVLKWLKEGELHILIGTHAVLEDPVEFKTLGLAIIDEQHRFGVEQRSRLWAKSQPYPPHILVMTATPIPRTLAMTYYGDLDVSVIDELPPGRKPISTVHKTEAARPQVVAFMKEQIKEGRQIYVVFPLIAESEKLDLQNLQQGYEDLLFHFPKPEYQISVVHGRMKGSDKDFEMTRFISKKTQILVSTTVIEVGVDVPNATVMVIENTERFGLAQLHQLRGRVGRGGNQSYCILMTGFNISEESRKRINIMCRTNNGFEIAEEDLALRGPGDLEGTRQSGQMEFKLADLTADAPILQTARQLAQIILKRDPDLLSAYNKPLRNYLDHHRDVLVWSQIS